MTPTDLTKTTMRRNGSAHDKIETEMFPNGHVFNRLGLTLSKKGWTASVQWNGTCGARGTGKTQEDAIEDAIETAEREWNVLIFRP